MAHGLRLLAVDVGNTSTVAAMWVDGRVGRTIRCEGPIDDRHVMASSFGRFGNLDGVAYVSVVPDADAWWREWAQARSLPFHRVSYRDFPPYRKSSASRVFIDYPHPETIGADRLADAAGAFSRYGAPVLVMDFGTALTAAVVTRDKVWRGGVIAPGFALMRDYLFERTAKLPRMNIASGTVPKIGRTTLEAMKFGAIVGYRGMVREIVSELKRNFSEDFRLVATGGSSKWVLSGLDLPFVIDPSLTLYGTGLLAAPAFGDKSR